MIKVTDVSQKEKYINCDLIEKIELVPDTLVTLINGHSFMILEQADEIIERIISYKKKCNEAINNSSIIAVKDDSEVNYDSE